MQYDYAQIERCIRNNGYAIDQFFKSIGMSSSLFAQWKNGEKIPKYNQIVAIGEKLNMDYMTFVFSENHEQEVSTFNLSEAFTALQNAGFNVSRRKQTEQPQINPSPQPTTPEKIEKIIPTQAAENNYPSQPVTPEKPRFAKGTPSKGKQAPLSRYSVVCPKCKKLLPTEKRTVSVDRKDVKEIKIGYCESCQKYYTDNDSLRFKDLLMGNDRIFWSNLQCTTVNGRKLEFVEKTILPPKPTTKKKLQKIERAHAFEKKQIEREKKHLASLQSSAKQIPTDNDFQITEPLVQLPVLETTTGSCPFCKKAFGKMMPIKYLVFSNDSSSQQRFTSSRSCGSCRAVFLDKVQFEQVYKQTYDGKIYTISPSKFSTAAAMMEASRNKPEASVQQPKNALILPYDTYLDKIENLSTESKTVQVYANKCHCYKCREKFKLNTITNRTAVVETITGNQINVNVMFCKGCGQYFINIKALEEYRKLYGGLLFECTLSNDLSTGQFSWFDFAPDSVLSRCGYTVREGVTKEYRQAILRYILETGKAEKYEIIELIGSFIDWRIGRPQYEGACERWREDIHYVNNYQIQSQKKVYGLNFSQAGKIRRNW